MPEDTEELALTLNGKKRKIRQSDFTTSMLASGLTERIIANIEKKFRKVIPKWVDTIDASFLPTEIKRIYKRQTIQRAIRNSR